MIYSSREEVYEHPIYGRVITAENLISRPWSSKYRRRKSVYDLAYGWPLDITYHVMIV